MTYEETEAQRRQFNAVWLVTIDGVWRTLEEIQRALLAQGIYAPLQSISARLRDFRKKKFGGHTVHRFYWRKGVWKYKLERAK